MAGDRSFNRNFDHIEQQLKTLPETPGVYQYFDEGGNLLYVGKARNLSRRVHSYFNHYDDLSPKIKILVRKIYTIRYTVVNTEVDALLLENNLIKTLQPKYNSMLKDDKTYPYLCLTAEEFPRLLFTRDRQKTRGTFFGPYPNQKILRELQEMIRNVFLYRTCKLPLTRKSVEQGKFKACINAQIGLCNAPCTGNESYEHYNATIDNIRRILKGDFGETLNELKAEMTRHADALEFEQAEAVKQKIMLLNQYQSRSTVVDTSVRDLDVFSILSDEKFAYVNMMRIKNGGIIHSFSTEIKKQLDESDADILAVIIPELHQSTQSTAKEVVVPIKVDLPDEYLHQIIPTRGAKKELLELSLRNVKFYQHERFSQRLLVDPDAGKMQLLEKIQKELGLPELPRNIECFDNSNIQGEYAVAAMVHFTDGKPDRQQYRHFNIKTVDGPDDYASMEEVVRRRYTRLRDEQKPLPQLIIVDGGKGQMEVVRRVLHGELSLAIPIAGLAKDDHHRTSELLYGFPPVSIGIAPRSPLFHLLEQIQNEVHRFAITFHRNKRSKGTFKTALTEIPGIGEKTARELLLQFKSVKQIRNTPLEDLAKCIGMAKAKVVYDFFRS